MPTARNSAALKRPAWMKGVVDSVTFTMNRFARRAVLTRVSKNYKTNILLSDIARYIESENRWELNEENTTIPCNYILTIREGEILWINNGKSLTNNGEIIISSGDNTGIALFNGILTNNGIIIINNSAFLSSINGIINNNNGIIIINNSAFLASIDGIINNGIINNSGTISNQLVGTITNNGIINNSGTITNSGIINNSGTIRNNSGTITNNEGIYVYNGGLLNNISGPIINNGVIGKANPAINPGCGTGTIIVGTFVGNPVQDGVCPS